MLTICNYDSELPCEVACDVVNGSGIAFLRKTVDGGGRRWWWCRGELVFLDDRRAEIAELCGGPPFFFAATLRAHRVPVYCLYML